MNFDEYFINYSNFKLLKSFILNLLKPYLFFLALIPNHLIPLNLFKYLYLNHFLL